MDGKPQRLRNVRVLGDENVAPHRGKTIHQRNKSSPALSSIAATGGLKVAAKRTAFGDVSNTTNGPRQTKDDSIVAIKEIGINTEKITAAIPDKKAPPLSKPAQRPITVSSLKSLLTGTSNSNTADVPKRSIVAEAQPSTQVGNARKAITKRSTTIFKDPNSLPPDTQTTGSVTHRAPLQQIPNHNNTVVAATSGTAHTSEPQTLSSESNNAEVENLPRSSHTTAHGENGPVRSDGVCIGGSEEGLCQADGVAIAALHKPAIHPGGAYKATLADQVVAQSAKSTGQGADGEHAPQRYSYPIPSEPEEYWDDEDEENYGEDGYVTARSCRSRGENTTGAATMILFPQTTKSVRRELAAAKQVVEASRTQEEVEDEEYDTSMVAEYSNEIFAYLKDLETKMLPNAHYMDNQAEINWSMRSVLMDWLIQVHHRFGLLPETLFLAVNYIDRFLSCKVVSLGKLQLVGATAIFIAAKYEEINCPSVQEIVYMVDSGYTIDEILKAERFMLSMLQFELGWPGPMSFLRRISKADDYDLETRTLAKYFLEVTVMDERFVGSPPSFTSAAAHCLARIILRKGTWSQSHVFYSGYTFAQLSPLLQLLVECCERPQKHHAAVFDKYCDKRFKRASLFVETEIRNGFRVPSSSTRGELPYQAPYINQGDGSTWYPLY